MNVFDGVLFFLACLPVFFYAWKKFGRFGYAALAVTILLPALYVSIEASTQFLSCDEFKSVNEAININDPSAMKNWQGGADRTTDALIGTTLRIFQLIADRVVNYPKSGLIVIAKMLHWLAGFIVIIIIFELLSRHFIPSAEKWHYFIVYFYSVLLLPINITALKVFNYDLLSMLLGMLAIVLVLTGLKTGRSGYSTAAVIIAAFAAQEKLIASPVLVFTQMYFTYSRGTEQGKPLLRTTFLAAITALLLTIAAGAATFLLTGISGSIPSISFTQMIFPFTSYVLPLLRLAGGAFSFVSAPVFLAVTLLIIWLVPSAAVIAGRYLGKRIQESSVGEGFLCRFERRFGNINTGLFILLMFAGISGVFFVRIFFHPMHPVEPGRFQSTYAFNNIVEHFGAYTRLGHIGYCAVTWYAVFITMLPSVLVLVLLSAGIRRFVKKGAVQSLPAGWTAFLSVCFAVPFLYAIVFVPVSIRYLNICILAVTIIIGMEFILMIDGLKQHLKRIAVAVFCILLFAELLPFRPVIAAFRPTWCNYPELYNVKQPVGESIPGAWPGWGEEIMMTGKKIVEIAKPDKNSGEKLRIYYGYYGVWLSVDKYFTYHPIGETNRYTKNDYYVINRAAIIQKWCNFPEGIRPFLTVSFRGYTLAWVFRGDQFAGTAYEELMKHTPSKKDSAE